jgi:hypothetical protein
MYKTFQIQARTVCLGNDPAAGEDYLLKDGVIFHIPIFQRPYSWGKTEIDKFIKDLFSSFWGISREDPSESLFIGTMQLTEQKGNEDWPAFYNVIDGQQRLTTFLVLLRTFQWLYPDAAELQQLDLNWLRSSVSNGAQQDQLDEFLACSSMAGFEAEKVSKFKINALLVAELIKAQTAPYEDRTTIFRPPDFIQHLFTNVYFVVIETHATLTKTLQIFKAINTTGLDLNGADIFKLRLFEYLKDREPGRKENDIFLEISALYTTIDEKNKAYRATPLSMGRALSIYKYVLIQRLGLPNVLYDVGTDTFFENLFDAYSRNAQPEHFRRMGDPQLSCAELRDIITAMIHWEELAYPTAQEECLMHLIWNSRYGRFDILMYLFLYRFRDDPQAGEKLFPFLQLLSKLYWCYSVIFQRRVYHLLTWTYNCLDVLMDRNKDYEETLSFIRQKLAAHDQYGRQVKWAIAQLLDGGITFNYRTKTLICRLSAMIDEAYTSTDDQIRKAIVSKLFQEDFDVEHIQSAKDSDLLNRPAIAKAWENDIDTLGNLVALEQKINRGIGNRKYVLKIPSYRNSKYVSVRLVAEQYTDWTQADCQARRQSEKEKLMAYIFS